MTMLLKRVILLGTVSHQIQKGQNLLGGNRYSKHLYVILGNFGLQEIKKKYAEGSMTLFQPEKWSHKEGLLFVNQATF